MNYIKRWTSGALSRIDRMVAHVENHEALINEALRDLQRGTARAQVQLKRVRKDSETLKCRLAEERGAVIQWRERAKRTIDDEKRALECLHRSKQAKRTVDELERRFEEHERTESQLAKDVRTLEEQLDRLKEQRNLMRTRESRADALGVVQSSRVALDAEVEEIFARWETRVAEGEFAGACSLRSEDGLEEEFRTEEEKAVLKAELEELRRD